MSRIERVTEAIRKEVSLIIHDHIKDPRLGFVTITRVEVAPDMSFAKIYFSVLGNDDAYRRTKEALDSALGFIRKMLAERINLRFAPDIIFREDRSSEYSVRIEEILNEIHSLENKACGQKVRKEKRLEPKKGRSRHKKK
jgi:ribosome-binding factor A